MNKLQKKLNRGIKANIKRFPLSENETFHKRRNLFIKAYKIEVHATLNEQFIY